MLILFVMLTLTINQIQNKIKYYYFEIIFCNLTITHINVLCFTVANQVSFFKPPTFIHLYKMIYVGTMIHLLIHEMYGNE